ncbi:hypothetical protein Q5X61_01095 [Acinetobacter baumannii]|nr:hypothetical protein [Acinetobacter baumannii]MDO7442334.1 hypothetical protein [Acinetobacter baumannii]MDV7668622.1 hypothetical protein [Acinetobacter baumannii]
MAKKTLEEKINIVKFWTVLGILIFLFISFFLKSSYPITHYEFNLSDAYDVLKDTLTLAAAFLAPVAAFILFNDWRENHRLVNSEYEVFDILKEFESSAEDHLKKMTNMLSDNTFNMSNETVKSNHKWALDYLININQMKRKIEFSKKKFKNTEFHDLCLEINSLQHKLLIQEIMFLETHLDLERCLVDLSQHSVLPGLYLQKQRVSEKFSLLLYDYSSKFEDRMNNLNFLASDHRI